MLDRIPRYPGRVRLTPVSGQTNIYDMVRADEPVQEGTPINKNTLLTDATAAALGLSSDATVDDALGKLKTLVDAGTKIETGSYTGTGTYGTDNPNRLTLGFKPKLFIVGRHGLRPDGNSSSDTWTHSFIWYEGYTQASCISANNVAVTATENGIEWYQNSQSNASYQCNTDGTVYYYIAIG